LCHRIESCEQGLLTLSHFPDHTACVNWYEAACSTVLAAPNTGFTPALAEECAGALMELPCDGFVNGQPLPACTPQGGKTPNGGSCSTGWQCASGACSISFPPDCGTCVDGPGCFGNNETQPGCTPGLLCPVCAPQVDTGGPCTDSSVCEGNTYCDAKTNLCTPLPGPGQPCDPSRIVACDLTQPLTLCDQTTSICTAPKIQQPGDPCVVSSDVDANFCLGTCVGNPNGPETCVPNANWGQLCSSDMTETFCVFGTSCQNGACFHSFCE
jgi:hypothetical protein